MGHRVCVTNQRYHIRKYLDELKCNQSFMVMDFKIKFQSMYYREKTTQFYGKKGESWHGTMVYSRYTKQEKEDYQTTLMPHHITYYDCISSGDTIQD